jgi:phage anti-repressor protein
MEIIKTVKNEKRALVSAQELYAAMKRTGNVGNGNERDSYRSWLADRIVSLEMEEGYDFFIYLDVNSIIEMIRYEPAPIEVKRFLEEYSH